MNVFATDIETEFIPGAGPPPQRIITASFIIFFVLIC
jgi:hypothetical protein